MPEVEERGGVAHTPLQSLDRWESQAASLPGDWKVARLGEVVRFSQGISWGKNEEDPEGIPVVGIPNVRNGKVWFDVRYRVRKELPSGKALRDGDILLVASSGSIQNVGRAAIADRVPYETCAFASFLVKAEPLPAIERQFLYFLLGSRLLSFSRCSKRAADGKYNLQVEGLRGHQIPLPPLAEQRAIARVLRTVQRAREQTEAVIAATRQLKASLKRHLFTYGPVPIDQADQVPLKETEIGPTPDHWEVAPLRGAVLKTKQVDPRKRPHELFQYVDVSSVASHNLRIERVTPYQGRDAPSRARKLINEGDVLFATVRPYLKRVAMVPRDLGGNVCSTAFCVLRVNPRLLDSAFLFFTVSSEPFVAAVSEHQRGSSYPAVTDGDVLGELIRLPPLGEQREIARVLLAVRSKLGAEEARKRTLHSLFSALLDHLMTARVRVKDLAALECPGAA